MLRNGADVVEQFWPYDGPCSPELLGEAGEAVVALVRYLNNHTRSGEALPYAADVDALVGDLFVAAASLDQLLTHLASRTERLSRASGVYDDRGDRAAADTAAAAVEALTTARRAGSQLASALQQVRAHTAHLGGPELPESGEGSDR